MTRGTHKRDSQEGKSREKEVLRSFLGYFLRDQNIKRRTITSEQERFLLSQIRNEDQQAETDLISAYDWFIQASADLYIQSYPDIPKDLAKQLTSAALTKAARLYSVKSRSYGFAEYAMWWILRAYGIPLHEQWVDTVMREVLPRRRNRDG